MAFLIRFEFPICSYLARFNQLARKSCSLDPTEKVGKLQLANAVPNCRNGFIQPLSIPHFYLVKMRSVSSKKTKAAFFELLDDFRKWLAGLPRGPSRDPYSPVGCDTVLYDAYTKPHDLILP